MRTLLAIAILVLAAGSAQAERKMFIISTNADGYGVDRCLANGEKCGAAAAAAYCRTRQFSDAASFQQVDKDEITGSIPTAGPGTCPAGKCDQYVAIVCTR
ncbi:MAG: hypothetical protein JOZ70_12475 [Pseudolabrys sp.]|nr:hypothetical protein [Pseudolabrys sp.]MBV9956052.1 hypothetical protein [Pseudolabrys sp.]